MGQGSRVATALAFAKRWRTGSWEPSPGASLDDVSVESHFGWGNLSILMGKMWENDGKYGKMWENDGKDGKCGKHVVKYGKHMEK